MQTRNIFNETGEGIQPENRRPYVLNDFNIRKALREFLQKSINPLLIIDEFRIHNGNAIADLVSVNNELQCFEIKGETDNIARISIQCEYYDTIFPFSTLVTTENQLSKALKYAPAHWGILIASHGEKVIQFQPVRKPKKNPTVNIDKALLSLWKNELSDLYLSIYKTLPNKKYNRSDLISQIAQKISRNKLNLHLAAIISNRYYNSSLQINDI
ncbi:sce7726 family protein [Leptospira selangorensis]|uniref:sce7726 family protein n=1 Tax=Leptospira selangorensis TaxID=2484982 RepID=UPI0014383339|nr:sce7726 family protein [Leptospira selangorensis]